MELLDGLVETGDVLERDLGLILGDLLRLGLAELHHPVSATLHLREDEDHEAEQEQPRQQIDEEGEEAGRLRVGGGFDVVVFEELGDLVLELSRIRERIGRVGLEVGVFAPDLEHIRLREDAHGLDLVTFHQIRELTERQLFGGTGGRGEHLHGHQGPDEDQRIDENGSDGAAHPLLS